MPLTELGYQLIRNLSAGNSKTGVVPSNRFWVIQWGHIKMTTTPTPGNRLLVMQVKLPGDPDPLARTFAPSAQGPSTVQRYQLFPGILAPQGLHTGEVMFMALPNVPIMLEGWEFTLHDVNNVDPNDHLELRALIVKIERD